MQNATILLCLCVYRAGVSGGKKSDDILTILAVCVWGEWEGAGDASVEDKVIRRTEHLIFSERSLNKEYGPVPALTLRDSR